MTSDLNLNRERNEANLSCYLCQSTNLRIKFSSTQNSIRTGSAYYNCTSFGHNIHEDIVDCVNCGLVSLKEIPTRSELENIYNHVIDPLYIEEKENRYYTFRNVLKDVRKHTINGKLLDVGCYCGYFLDVARESGFDVEGLELSKWAFAQALQLGVPVYNSTLSSLGLDGHFDTITMWDVIEHCSDPRAELREINRLLKEGGFLFLSTINIGSFVARLMGPRWPWLMDMHIFYFDKRTITKILEEQGFHVVQIKNYTHYVSSKYLIEKLAHISKLAELVLKSMQSINGEFKIPFNLGDNMLVIARKL